MTDDHALELFVLKCAVLECSYPQDASALASQSVGTLELDASLQQFDAKSVAIATEMAKHYRVFYLLENEIRRLISETLSEAHGEQWWATKVPEGIQNEVERNKSREVVAAISNRSEAEIDYTTFGQLGDIIRANWSDFAGIMSNQSALNRVLHQLNLSRGPIAHCGLLAEDEVDRLYLTIKDWFRVLAGPSSK